MIELIQWLSRFSDEIDSVVDLIDWLIQVHEYKVGKHRIKSKMEIDPATQKDGGFYECQADNKYAVDRRGFRTDFTLDVY